MRVLVDSHTFNRTLLSDPSLSKKPRQRMTSDANELLLPVRYEHVLRLEPLPQH